MSGTEGEVSVSKVDPCGTVFVGGEEWQVHCCVGNVTLHMTLKLKVIARSQHTHTTRLVCPEDTDMRIFNCVRGCKTEAISTCWTC